MSKQVKAIAGCELPSGERLALRRVDDRVGPTLISSHLELLRGDTALATGPTDIEAALSGMELSTKNKKWLLGHLRLSGT